MVAFTLQHLLILTSFLLILSFQSSLLVKSDDALIQSLCSKTPEPVICNDCLHRDPTGKTADGRGLAVLSINCAVYDATILYNFTFDLWQNTPDSKAALKQVLETCSGQMLVGRDSYQGAVDSIRDGRFDWKGYAIDQIKRQVAPFLNKCLDLFNKSPRLPLPDKILAGTNIVNQDNGIVLGILNNIT